MNGSPIVPPSADSRTIGPERFQRRQPVANRAGVWRALASGAVLLALLVGMPALLLWLGGVPRLPTSLPSREDLTATIGTEQMLTVLVWVAWLAWLQFAVCVVVELRSALSGVGLPSRVPMSGLSQRFARVLVGSVLLAASAVGPAAATTSEPVAGGASATAATTGDEGSAAPVEGAAARTSAATPEARQDAPSGTVAYRLGEVVIDADDAERLVGRKVYRVQPPEGRYHDNLWDIAERELGDGRRYREIFELNRGRTQPDGYELSLARLIYPNWLLVMPEDATVERVVAVPAPAAEAPAPAQAPADDPAQSDGGDTGAGVGAAGVEAESARSAHELVTAGLLAAGILATIEAVRRRRRTPEPGDDAVEVEVALRIGADPDRARWLDHALRSLASARQAAGRTLPPVYAAIVDGDSVEIMLAPASSDAPAPWQALDDGRRWRLDRAAAGPPGDAVAPYPGLVSLGRDETDHDILADLEAAGGPIAVVGDPTAALEVVTAFAAELATNRWSDHLRVTGSGLPEELTALGPARYRDVADVSAVLPELESKRAGPSGQDVLTGRVLAVGGGAWMPEYVALGAVPGADTSERLAALTGGARRSPLGVVCAGDLPGARWTFSVDAAGTLDASVLGLAVRANRLSRASAAAVATLVVPDPEPDAPAPTLHEQWLPESRPDIPEAPVAADDAALTAAPVRVFVLGPAEVQAGGSIDDDRRALATEIAVHLALHREGVHPTVLASAVWPRGVTAAVREAMFARVREWLGVDPDGSPYLLSMPDGRLRLSDEVIVDWDVVCTLLRRARAAATGAEEVELLRRALRVARGPVLSDRPRGRYAWIVRARLERLASDVLVDAAHRLSVLSGDGGTPGKAAAAARAGLRVRPAEQLLWRDLLRAEHAARGRSGVLEVSEELTATLGGLGVAELEAETTALLEDLLPRSEPEHVHPSGYGA
ncbi:MAG: hypothetical protein ACRDVN_07530 [Jiangellaceae bacterium]